MTESKKASSDERVQKLYQEELFKVHQRGDRQFGWLLMLQWLAAIVVALCLSPYTWQGKVHTTHLHVYYAVVVGGLITVPGVLLAWKRSGWIVTRYTLTISQILWSALLIHLTGGRIETHFHIFASLAFVAFYWSRTLLALATLVSGMDHLIRGLVWPESLYGINNPEWWRFIEHAGWMLFEDTFLFAGIIYKLRDMRTLATRQADLELFNERVEYVVVARTHELQEAKEEYRCLAESTRAIPWRYSQKDDRFSYIGPQATAALGLPMEAILDKGFLQKYLHTDDRASVVARFKDLGAGQHDIEMRLCPHDGSCVWVKILVSEVQWSPHEVVGVMIDVTEQRRMETELWHAQKLESVGRLASGIAHEINTPVQYANDAVTFSRDGFFSLLPILKAYRSLPQSGLVDAVALAEIIASEQTADIDYVIERLPKALDRATDGLERVASLVRSMKEFSHPGQTEKVDADVNHIIETALIIARNEYKYVADVITHFGATAPLVCHVGELSQVFLNLIVNASHAIADVVAVSHVRGQITIETSQERGCTMISVTDTGGGIPATVQSHLFEPFFTTKEVGRGTGQGLAIARNIVVDKHGGSLTFTTCKGVGSQFVVCIPNAHVLEKAS